MSENLIRLTPAGAVEHDRPAADRLISGTPEFKTWNIEDLDGLYCGIWQSTPGKWRIVYDEWEYFHILSGHSIITKDGANPVMLKPGDSFIIRPGFAGAWEVLETTIKDYVIRL